MSDVIEEGQKPQAAKKENDFSKGSVISNILKLALPMTLAQLINVLYNIVDRVYIGMIPENATLSLTSPWSLPLQTCSVWAARPCAPLRGEGAIKRRQRPLWVMPL